MTTEFRGAMEFPGGYNFKREKVPAENEEPQEPQHMSTASTVQKIPTGSQVLLSNQLIKMQKLVLTATPQLESMMSYMNFNLFPLM